ncbi:hypothetical protein E3N88_24175 [Mikania micrantha]|uniref:NTF2 domain-containing protein n=1 Tax=Mikania micrantha TaxID=192012 RepID=A0A5N6NFI2_9ASTR|nr:hypothetical protein E3N88_24175 [Mikania micrantha]
MDPDAVSKAFVEHYYSTFDTNRSGLANLYQESSMLTFEGQKIQGSQNIVNKLTSLPFQQCKHTITTVDCQPSGPAGGMLVFVSGNLQLAGEQHALKFSQLKSSIRRSSAIKVTVLELRRTEGVRLELRSVVEVAVGGGGSRSAEEFGWSRGGWNLVSIAILCGIRFRV